MKIVGVLLAAGHSRRFGADKLSHPLDDGEPIGVRSARRLGEALDDCVAVVRQRDSELCSQLAQLGFHNIVQTNPGAGMGDSLALAIRSTEQADAWLVALADMPWIQVDTLRQLVRGLRQGEPIVVPRFRGQRGHPVGFSSRFRQPLLSLRGDNGAKGLISGHADLVHRIEVQDAGILQDVDTVTDLTRVR